ncbi:MAG: PDZ domain-containing protein [Nitriliruptorales bacterium]|nr:PDZ domain-containing protein [Nitriliruptorales bacterium]
MKYRIAWLTSVLVVLTALAVVSVPFVAWSPGEAVDLRGAVAVDGAGEPLSGRLSLLTIRSKQARILDVLRSWIDGDLDLIDRDLVFGDREADEYYAAERVTFRNQLDISTIAALQALGRDIDVGQQVLEIVPGSPADGVLEVGDVLRAVDGLAVQSLADLRTELEQREPGDEVVVELERGSRRVDVTVTLDLLESTNRPGLGVRLQTHVGEVPVDVELADGFDSIGGPSAGLALALAIHDLLSPVDVVAGRRIAVTGRVDVDGVVGAIGGMRQKVIAAEDAGADLMIVPEQQADLARATATSVTVIGVSTLDEAIAALAQG